MFSSKIKKNNAYPCKPQFFRFGALAGVGAFVRAEFLCVSVLRVASGPRVKLASCKSALTPPPTPGGLLYWPF